MLNKAYEEISEEKNDFRLKIIKSNKVQEKKEIKKDKEIDQILKEAGAKLGKRDEEFENIDSFEKMEEIIIAKIKLKMSNI